MSRSRFCSAVISAAVLSAVASASMAQRARSPEQLMSNLIDAARAGNVPAFLSGVDPQSRRALAASKKGQTALDNASSAFQRALDERFGPSGVVLVAPRESLETAIGRLGSAQVLDSRITPRGAEIRVRTPVGGPAGQPSATRDETLFARREDGSWKLVLGFPRDIAGKQTAIIDRITQNVRTGEYRSRLDAMIALSSALYGRQS